MGLMDDPASLVSFTSQFPNPTQFAMDNLAGQVESVAASNADARQNAANLNNYQMQKEFAQNGIRWRVEDAKAAGLHPLAALSMSGSGASPSFAVGNGDFSAVSRGVPRSTLMENIMAALAMKRGWLENELLNIQVRKAKQALGPAGTPELKPKSATPVIGSRHNDAIDAGAINTMAYEKLGNGEYGITQSSDAKERNEDDEIAENLWHVRNRWRPPDPPVEWLPDAGGGAYRWSWRRLQQKFVPVPLVTPNRPGAPHG